MAITWAGGVNPIILDNGTFSWADIATADTTGGWGQFTSNGTNVPSYRSRVSIQVGNSANTTHLEDATGSIVIFDNTRTITGGGTSTARFITLGTKIGTGDEATGVRGGMICLGAAGGFSGTPKLYGLTVRQTVGALSFSPSANNTGEAINCLFQSTAAGTAVFNFGTQGTAEIDNIYNCDFSHTTANQVMSNLNCRVTNRITIGAAAPTALISSGAIVLEIKDPAFFGSPTQSDLRWAATSLGWKLYRPRFTGNAAKFSSSSAVSPNLDDVNLPQTREFWRYDVKVVDGTGAGISGIPVRLTDSAGFVQVDTTTDSSGAISFGADMEENMVCVADHYISSGYQLRHRSPFLVEFNIGSAAPNGNYPTRRYYFDWAGSETVTTTAGSFEDMNDVVNLTEPSGTPTNWVELEL